MEDSFIISIDWDHTLRAMAGLNLELLALSLCAKSKRMPVGITTHRDLENTALYTLYYWQFEKPEYIEHALAAAISYWDELCFQACDLNFDFINARYQPRHEGNNYYRDILYPHEKKLADEIIDNDILENQEVVKEKINEYAQKEPLMKNNEAKEAQLLWLSQQYNVQKIYHLDDSLDVCRDLPEKFKSLGGAGDIIVETIFHDGTSIFRNNAYQGLLEEIGLSESLANTLLKQKLKNKATGIIMPNKFLKGSN